MKALSAYITVLEHFIDACPKKAISLILNASQALTQNGINREATSLVARAAESLRSEDYHNEAADLIMAYVKVLRLKGHLSEAEALLKLQLQYCASNGYLIGAPDLIIIFSEVLAESKAIEFLDDQSIHFADNGRSEEAELFLQKEINLTIMQAAVLKESGRFGEAQALLENATQHFEYMGDWSAAADFIRDMSALKEELAMIMEQDLPKKSKKETGSPQIVSLHQQIQLLREQARVLGEKADALQARYVAEPSIDDEPYPTPIESAESLLEEGLAVGALSLLIETANDIRSEGRLGHAKEFITESVTMLRNNDVAEAVIKEFLEKVDPAIVSSASNYYPLQKGVSSKQTVHRVVASF